MGSEKSDAMKHKLHKRLISISVPVFNEESNLPALYERLNGVAEKLSASYELEFVFTDNNSTDNTWGVLNQLAAQDARIRALKFSRNFGFQKSILANYLHTRGEAVMQLDADLQDPPEMLESFLKEWEQGYKVVYGIRKSRPESYLMSMFRAFGYWVIDKLAGYHIPQNVGDFRLIDREVVNALASYRDHTPYLRGTIASLGFKHTGIEYERAGRTAGASKFNLRSLIGLGIDGLLTSSTVPLRIASFVGAATILMSFLGVVYYTALRLMRPELPIGLASTNILILFSVGLNSLFLGLIGEYMIRLHANVRGGDLVIIEERIEAEQDDSKPS